MDRCLRINMTIPVYEKTTKISPLNGPKFHGIYTVSNGTRYTQLQEMAAAQERPIEAILMDTLYKVLPILQDKLEYETMVDWATYPHVGGAFHYYEPNPNIPRYYDHLNVPHGNLFFAGEHTQYKTKGFDAALESGLLATKQILQSKTNRRVCILGCGDLGKECVKLWQKQHYHVTATTTQPTKLHHLDRLVDQARVWKTTSETAEAELREITKDATHIVCTIGPTPGRSKT